MTIGLPDGVTRNQSSKWQRVASLPEDVFEAEEYRMWERCGYESRDDLIRKAWGMDPEMVDWAILGVEALGNENVKKVAFQDAVELGKRAAQEIANDPEVRPVENLGANQHTMEEGCSDRTPFSKRGETAQYLIRRIKRDAADEAKPNHEQAKEALSKLQAGELPSARQAGIWRGS